jgi:23S rRNA (cytosine1962-C5)-methyltransferase
MLNLIYNEKPEEAQRLFHGRGKSYLGLEFLNIDYFPPVILITLYKEAANELLEAVRDQLVKFFADNLKTILIQKRYILKSPVELFYGENITEHVCQENHIKFSIKLGATQNIGFFLDMKLGRDVLVNYSKDKKILNLFSYTCAFSVVALKNGAREVVNIDMSKASLERGRENHVLNDLNYKQAKYYAHDILKSFGLLKRLAPFDFVIIDPPSDHGSHFLVDRDYSKLIARLIDWTEPGALVMTCLNSPFHTFGFLEDCVLKHAPYLELIEKCGAPISFMETDPEKGLKIILWRRPL